MLKTIICQHLMPVLIPLKNLMEKRHSPFLGELRRCMCAIVREFREEVKEIMANDPQLANELAFDLGREEPKHAVPRAERVDDTDGAPVKRTASSAAVKDSAAAAPSPR